MAGKNAPPSIDKTAFECPHCTVYTTQTWYGVVATDLGDRRTTPFVDANKAMNAVMVNKELEPEVKANLIELFTAINAGKVRFHIAADTHFDKRKVHNLNISRCYDCGRFAVWVHKSLVYPPARTGADPNPDLDPAVRKDFEEARTIVNSSPRGACALLRLAIQKLCVQLGGTGDNLNADIGTLVANGLHQNTQRSLDIVRVIGNEAVHPGQMDLADDVETATTLFGLVNGIADQMISHPKKVDALYGSLPESKRKQIEDRDKKAATAKPQSASDESK